MAWARYLWTWIALLLLTSLTFAISFAHTGAWEIPIALFIAVLKSTLVMLVFMHLIEEKFTSAFVILVTVALVGLLLSLVAADVLTRHTFPPAPLPEVLPPPPDTHAAPPGGAPSER